ncbi:MAG: transposase, partial [Actinomycetes bacterium]
ISTVDPTARHGHKTASRGFDGYKGHIAMDPDSEIITDTEVSAGNAADASVADDLLHDLLADASVAGDSNAGDDRDSDGAFVAEAGATEEADAVEAKADRPTVYGDAAYGTGEFQSRLQGAGIASGCKTQPPVAAGGRYAKDRFAIDLEAGTVTCPNNVTVTISPRRDGAGGTASFGDACATCPLRAQCSESAGGRTIRIGPHEAALARARSRQTDPAWKADYRAVRPKVERKLAHLVRRKHGGRRARVRGTKRIDADFRLLAAAVNLARLAVLGLHSTGAGWAAATA